MKTVINEIKVETNNQVKYLRTDNGLEFINKDVTLFLNDLGIVPELTLSRMGTETPNYSERGSINDVWKKYQKNSGLKLL
jgi:hypothetical protein